MKRIGKMIAIITVFAGLVYQAIGESLASKIGDAPVYMLGAVVTNKPDAVITNDGDSSYIATAMWHIAKILSTNKLTGPKTVIYEEVSATNSRPVDMWFSVGGPTTVTYREAGSNGCDMISVVFSVGGQTIETRQTCGVWILSLPNQNTRGKSNADLAVLVNSLAQEYLREFGNRRFVFDGVYDGVSLFGLPERRADWWYAGWRDLIWAIVDGTKVVFLSLKQEEHRQDQRGVSFGFDWNIHWFNSCIPKADYEPAGE